METGLIAVARGYKVGHIPFEVLTAVPPTFKGWFRQRLAWAGGEFRLFIHELQVRDRSSFLVVLRGGHCHNIVPPKMVQHPSTRLDPPDYIFNILPASSDDPHQNMG